MTILKSSEKGHFKRTENNLYPFFDGKSEEEYDDITTLAAEICKVPFAGIRILDTDHNRYNSFHGISPNEIWLDPSLGATNVESKEAIFIIPDLSKDKRFTNQISTIQKTPVLFYAAVPLVTKNGTTLGALTIIDNKPRTLGNNQISALKTLAKQIIYFTELRKSSILHENAFSNLYAINQDLQTALTEIEQYKTAIDSVAIVSITDTTGKITYVNDTFCEISGYTYDELIGQNQRIVNSGYHTKEFWKKMWKTISSGKIWHDHIRNKTKDGKIYWVETTIVPFIEEKTNLPYQYISIRKDITEQKNIEQAEIQSILFSQEIDRDNFAVDLHEGLAQRLVAINLHAQMIHDKIKSFDDSKLNGSIEFIMEQVLKSIEASRNMAMELMPRSMMTEGLVPSVQSFLTLINSKYSIEIDLKSTFIDNSRPSKSIEITIYRAIVSIINKAIQTKLIQKIVVVISQEPTIECKIKIFCSDDSKKLDKKPLSFHLNQMDQLIRRTELNGARINITHQPKLEATEIVMKFD